MNYRPFIDGLRALAVLAVLFYHFDLGVPGGYVGVDVFFVISGYLITSIILKDLAQERFHMVAFWERRIRRILPALAVVVGACLLLGWGFLVPEDFKRLGRSTLSQVYLGSNFYFMQAPAADYFAPAVDIKPLLHTWSLAVEEQFYLFFPLILWFVRRWPRPKLVQWLIGGSVLSLGLSIWGVYYYPTATFYMLPARAWELCVGALLAASVNTRPAPARWLAEGCSTLGLLAIVYALFGYTTATPFPGAAALAPCLGTGLIIWANEQRVTWVGKLLSWRGLVGIGLISYSLYLWHWPVLEFAKYWFDPLALPVRMVLATVSIGLAWVTWKYVETPFRQRRVCASRGQILGFAGLAFALMLTVGMVIHHVKTIVPWGMPTAALQYYAQRDAAILNVLKYHRKLADIQSGQVYELGTGDQTQPIQFLIWGDSHAHAVMPLLELMCHESGMRGVGATYSGMAPVVGVSWLDRSAPDLGGDPRVYQMALLDFIRQHKVPNVLLVARWEMYDKMNPDTLAHDLPATIALLRQLGTRVWIMKMVPSYPQHIPRLLAKRALQGKTTESLSLVPTDYLAEKPYYDALFGQFVGPEVKILDPLAYFVDAENLGRVVLDGKMLYWDKNHVTLEGAKLIRPMLVPLFAVSPATSASRPDGSESARP
ncbi:MAG: acyltransferase family protein [Phycisphaerae bacterium]